MMGVQAQMCDVAKRRAAFWEPSTVVYGQRPSVIGWGVGGIRKRVPPGHHIGIVAKTDGENEFSISKSPRFGNNRTRPECIRLVVELVDGVVVKFWGSPGLKDIVWDKRESKFGSRLNLSGARKAAQSLKA